MRSRSADQHAGQGHGSAATEQRPIGDPAAQRPTEVLLARAAAARRYQRAQRRAA